VNRSKFRKQAKVVKEEKMGLEEFFHGFGIASSGLGPGRVVKQFGGANIKSEYKKPGILHGKLFGLGRRGGKFFPLPRVLRLSRFDVC